ncbi:IS3 family transposase [Rhodococcus pseudokoreensis]|uniref:IS3 family transposase n=1 Tax=Rhodococcus pseudokoreensis TaxID=2811421 RepID=UPI003B8453AA
MLGLGYYAAKKRPPSHRTIRDAELTERIVRTHRDNYWVYGVRKVHATPQREGVPVARCTVERLMRSAGQRGISRRPGPLNTRLAPPQHQPGDLVSRCSAPIDRTGRGSPTSRTDERSPGSLMRPAAVLDVFSRRVIGWQIQIADDGNLAPHPQLPGSFGTGAPLRNAGRKPRSTGPRAARAHFAGWSRSTYPNEMEHTTFRLSGDHRTRARTARCRRPRPRAGAEEVEVPHLCWRRPRGHPRCPWWGRAATRTRARGAIHTPNSTGKGRSGSRGGTGRRRPGLPEPIRSVAPAPSVIATCHGWMLHQDRVHWASSRIVSITACDTSSGRNTGSCLRTLAAGAASAPRREGSCRSRVGSRCHGPAGRNRMRDAACRAPHRMDLATARTSSSRLPRSPRRRGRAATDSG